MRRMKVRKDILSRIGEKGKCQAFHELALGNAAMIIRQTGEIRKNMSEPVEWVTNGAIAMTIQWYKKCWLMDQLYDCVLYQRRKNVIEDEEYDRLYSAVQEMLRNG